MFGAVSTQGSGQVCIFQCSKSSYWLNSASRVRSQSFRKPLKNPRTATAFSSFLTFASPSGARGPPQFCKQKKTPRIWADIFQKSLGVHKIIVREIWVSPPKKKGPKWEKTVQISIKSSKVTLFWGGGGKRDFMDKTILWTSGRFWSLTHLFSVEAICQVGQGMQDATQHCLRSKLAS